MFNKKRRERVCNTDWVDICVRIKADYKLTRYNLLIHNTIYNMIRNTGLFVSTMEKVKEYSLLAEIVEVSKKRFDLLPLKF